MSSLDRSTKFHVGPIAVGALGGSGTRVVAEIIREVGFYIGEDLNHALDNLWFTFLFKRPRWFMSVINENPSIILDYIKIFEKKMTGMNLITRDYFTVLKVALGISISGPKSSQGLWLVRRIISLMRPGNIDLSRYVGWGWKEPNSHIYLEYLARYFQDLKYIYVIRHGLDMAYSNNQQQLYNWGPMFSTEVPKKPTSLPRESLKYWIKASRQTIELGNKLLGKRFLLLNFDNLCLSPEREITSLIDFLGINIDSERLACLTQLPKLPRSSGRYKKHDITIFPREDIESVRSFGFVIE